MEDEKTGPAIDQEFRNLHEKAKLMDKVPLKELDKWIKYRREFAQMPINDHTKAALKEINENIMRIIGVI